MIDCNLQGTRSPSHQYESRRLGGFLLCPFQTFQPHLAGDAPIIVAVTRV